MHVKFASLPVLDEDRAIEFYTKHLGLTVAKDVPYSDDWRWVELALPAARTHLLFERRGRSGKSERPDVVIAVEALSDVYERMKNSGVEFLSEPETASWNPVEISVLFHDSEENLILLTEAIEEA